MPTGVLASRVFARKNPKFSPPLDLQQHRRRQKKEKRKERKKKREKNWVDVVDVDDGFFCHFSSSFTLKSAPNICSIP